MASRLESRRNRNGTTRPAQLGPDRFRTPTPLAFFPPLTHPPLCLSLVLLVLVLAPSPSQISRSPTQPSRRGGGGGAQLTGLSRGWTAAGGWAASGGPRRRRRRSGASPRCRCCTPSSPRTGSPSPSSRARSAGRSPAPSSSVSTHLPFLPSPVHPFPRLLRLRLVIVHRAPDLVHGLTRVGEGSRPIDRAREGH